MTRPIDLGTGLMPQKGCRLIKKPASPRVQQALYQDIARPSEGSSADTNPAWRSKSTYRGSASTRLIVMAPFVVHIYLFFCQSPALVILFKRDDQA